MALPVILVNSATGSDTQASGAGPATALFGTTNASTDGAGTTVTLPAGTDLSGIAIDGSHVIYLADATAGARNFGKITGSAGSGGATPTVTVSNAFGLTLSGKSWAIGGKRASILGTSSVKLIENNAGSGDAMPGWIMELQSGHTESSASTVSYRRPGDTTSGSIILRGAVGAATMPILTSTVNADFFQVRANYWTVDGFELRNTNHGASSQAFNIGNNAVGFYARGLRIDHATDHFQIGLSTFSAITDLTIESCSLRNLGASAISFGNSGAGVMRIRNNDIMSCGSHGMLWSGTSVAMFEFEGNIVAFNGGDGYRNTSGTSSPCAAGIKNNVFHGNASDGIEITGTSAQLGWLTGLLIESNEFTFNTGVGVNLSGSGITDALLSCIRFVFRNNNFFNNSSGKYSGITALSTDELTTDPSGGLALANKDYAGVVAGSNFMSSVHKAKGWPIGGTLAVGSVSSSYSYRDIGLQHQDAGGGGTTVIVVDDD